MRTICGRRCNGLERKRLAGRARSGDGRVTKYEHWLGEAFNFSRAETALFCVLLLRGPQTPGELRGRTERLHSFEEISDVLAGLQKLMDREPPLAALLPRQPGTKEARYAHLLCGPVESIVQPMTTGAAELAAPDSPRMKSALEQLETTVEELRQAKWPALTGEDRNLFWDRHHCRHKPLLNRRRIVFHWKRFQENTPHAIVSLQPDGRSCFGNVYSSRPDSQARTRSQNRQSQRLRSGGADSAHGLEQLELLRRQGH